MGTLRVEYINLSREEPEPSLTIKICESFCGLNMHDDPFFATELAQQNLRQQSEDEFDIQLSLL